MRSVGRPGGGAAPGLRCLDGPVGSWAVVWQTDWDTQEDAGEFGDAARDAVEDLAGSPSSGAFTVTDVFTRAGGGPDLTWTGDVPQRLAAAFEAAGEDLLGILHGGGRSTT